MTVGTSVRLWRPWDSIINRAVRGALPGPQRWPLKPRGIVVRRTDIRGVKTQTSVRASDLPQGPLSPLPRGDADSIPDKRYPDMLQEHLNNIRNFPDCIVLTRVGDFYEMYFDQVDLYAPLLNLKKAKKATALGDVPMAGFQYTSLDRYLKQLVQDHGFKVAISEQLKKPGPETKTGAQYYRKVTRVVTPGTLIDENFMNPDEHNYLLAIQIAGSLPSSLSTTADREAYERYRRSTKVGLSWVDLSSGDFSTQQSDLNSLPSLVARIGPREVVLDATWASIEPSQLQEIMGDGNYLTCFHTPSFLAPSVAAWTPMLERPMSEGSTSDFSPMEISAASLVLDYVRDKVLEPPIQLQRPVHRSDDEYMTIDKQSLRNLEIRNTLRDGSTKGSLLQTVRQTVTGSGKRLLSQRIVSPSTSLSVINHRLDLVQEMLQHDVLREGVVGFLRCTSDTRRLVQKFSVGRGDADDLLCLARTVRMTEELSALLHDHVLDHQDVSDDDDKGTHTAELTFLWDILGRLDLDGPAKVAKNIQDAIDEEGLNQQHVVEAEGEAEAEQMAEEVMTADEAGEEVPKLSRRRGRSAAIDKNIVSKPEDIWIMKRHASRPLARAHEDLAQLLVTKDELAASLKQQLNTETLTLKWNGRHQFFCHIKGKGLENRLAAVEGARRVESRGTTLSFSLPAWADLGDQIDSAKLRIRAEEEQVFRKLRVHVLENLMKLRRNAAVLDELDVACSSAVVAKSRNLVRPILHNGTSHKIIGGRHPTVDVGLTEQGRNFTSNDCAVGDGKKIYLITGPNMAGKSTYLRQNALITILAQTGCFVPAEYAEIGLVDKIFSRVGSADNLYQNQSTFMLEMLETADILKQATPRSFVIMDEVGRGTTPEDGIAVGYACLHHLQHENQCRALFATHFHALADMTRDFDDVACYCTDVVESEDGFSFEHKLRAGVNRESHALKVARLAGLPDSAIAVAAGVLAELRRSRNKMDHR